jgi:hypothetical protein
VPRSDQHRDAGRTEDLQEKASGIPCDVLVLEEIAGAGDQVGVRLLGSGDDPLERRPQVAAALFGGRPMKALASKRSIEMQVSEVQ